MIGLFIIVTKVKDKLICWGSMFIISLAIFLLIAQISFRQYRQYYQGFMNAMMAMIIEIQIVTVKVKERKLCQG